MLTRFVMTSLPAVIDCCRDRKCSVANGTKEACRWYSKYWSVWWRQTSLTRKASGKTRRNI